MQIQVYANAESVALEGAKRSSLKKQELQSQLVCHGGQRRQNPVDHASRSSSFGNSGIAVERPNLNT